MADRSGKRRWPWAAAAAVSALVLGAAGWWLAGAITAFAARPLSDQDGIASVTSMVTGSAALLVALASLVVAVLQLRRAEPATPNTTRADPEVSHPETPQTGTPRTGTTQTGTARDDARMFMVANGDIHLHETEPLRSPPEREPRFSHARILRFSARRRKPQDSSS